MKRSQSAHKFYAQECPEDRERFPRDPDRRQPKRHQCWSIAARLFPWISPRCAPLRCGRRCATLILGGIGHLLLDTEMVWQARVSDWMSLTRWADCANTVAPVDLGDSAREDAEANVPTPGTNPKESGDVKRSRHERTHVEQMKWCSSCVASRGTCDSHRKSDNYSGLKSVECDFVPLLSRVQIASPGWIINSDGHCEGRERSKSFFWMQRFLLGCKMFFWDLRSFL